MQIEEREDEMLQSVALQIANAVHVVRQRGEEDLLCAKQALEAKTEELARSLAMMKATLESTTDGILVTNAAARITGYNQRFVNMFHIPADLLDAGLHAPLLERARERIADPDRFIARIREIYDTSPPETFDLLKFKDGGVFERFSRLQFVEGRNEGRVWSFREITERRRLEEVRNQLAAIVESSDDAIISQTLTGTIMTWNRGAERMFGHLAHEVIGKSITLLIPPDRLDELPVNLGRIERVERVEQYESLRMRKDGTLVDVSLTMSPVCDGSGNVVGASTIVRDVTQRKRADESLLGERRVLELLNETGATISAQLEMHELMQLVIDSATQLCGARFGAYFHSVIDERGEFFQLLTLSGAPREAFEKFGLPRITPVFEPTFRGQGVVRSDDITRDPRYGTMAPHRGMPPGHLPVKSYLAVSVKSRTGAVIGGLVFGHPEAGVFTLRTEKFITNIAAQTGMAIDNARLYEEAKRTSLEREQLLDAERAARSAAERISVMKDEFLATVSHELRTPLNSILGWSRLLASKKLSHEDFQQGLDTIQRNARAQAQLIEDLLDMSRIVSGKVRLNVLQTDLATVVESAVNSIRPSADAKGIRMRQVMDPHIGPFTGDPTRLQQVVWNLLSNAVKFTPHGGSVDVSLRCVSAHLEITVSDSGQGIRPDFLPHVFERFRQADSSTTRKYGGLGLGLAIVKQLVELHGGSVTAHSAGEGKGATFTVCLPVAPIRGHDSNGDLPSTPTTLAGTNGMDIAGTKILVIDDEADARDLIRRMLVECDAEVFTASCAAEGLKLVQSERPDVILSDIGMPGSDGYCFIREVRRLPMASGGRTPALALTAFARTEDRTRAMVAGYQFHIAKPIEPQELIAAVASLAGRMQHKDE